VLVCYNLFVTEKGLQGGRHSSEGRWCRGSIPDFDADDFIATLV